MRILIVIILLIIIYLYLIAPSLKKDLSPFRGRYYAHRGLFDNTSQAPENSLAAFKKAVDASYGIEFDVQLTGDGKAVICHDFDLKRMYRDSDGNAVHKQIDALTYEELQAFHILDSEERMPLFKEALELIDGKVPLIIELKVKSSTRDMRLCETVDEILKDYKGLYCIESFDPRVLYRYRKKRPDIIRGQLSMDYHRADRRRFKSFIYVFMTYLLTDFLTRPDFIAYDHRHKRNLSRVLCHSLFRGTAVAYTIKSQKELDEDRDDFDIFIFDSFIPH